MPHTRVLCLDEWGPLAAKTYPGAEWKAGAERATFEPDYARRGKLWVHGAFEPATGQATLVLSERRDSASHIQLLEQVLREFPAERWILIEDNLSTHRSRAVQLALLAHPEVQVLFLPRYACWLNLIEPWWKQLRALSLAGRHFESVTALTQAVDAGWHYWQTHRHPYHWKKRPQEQPLLMLGGLHPELTMKTVLI